MEWMLGGHTSNPATIVPGFPLAAVMIASLKSHCTFDSHPTFNLQGFIIRLFPGCVKLVKKIVFCLPTAGRRTQLVPLLEILCNARCSIHS